MRIIRILPRSLFYKNTKNISRISKMSLGTTSSAYSDSVSKENDLPKFETLLLSVPQPFVYHVELNRPSKRNAMNHQMWLDVQQCFEKLNQDNNCRTIVLSGIGTLFCAGIDLQCLMDIGQSFKPNDDVARKCKVLYKIIRLYQKSLSSIENCVKPVISTVHNACIGAGINMVCATDIRYCTSDAWFQIKEVDLGMAADVGVLQRLPKIIGSASLTRELIFTGRKFPAEEAKEAGFVSKIFDSKENMINESIKVATQIAAKSPVAVQTSKKSLIYSRDHSVEEGLEHMAMMNQIMLQSEDLIAAIMISSSKTPDPQFSKL